MVKQVLGIDGNKRGEITLADEVFNTKVSQGSIYYALKNELANRRAGTASTKGRSEIRGSGSKPWRQKGTGRARAGSWKSPIRVGGGRAFGPKPRNYGYKLPKKVKRLAIRSLLTLKNREDRVKIVEDFSVESGKTRDLISILKNFSPVERMVIILGGEDPLLRRAGRNIPGLDFLSFNRLSVHQLFYGKQLLLLRSAAQNLNELYAGNKVGAGHGD